MRIPMEKENKIDFQQGKLFPMILKFSIPAAISLLITAVYNIVDRIFVGNFNGTSALAGLSVCFPLFFQVNGIFLAQPASDALALILSGALVLREHKRLLVKGVRTA